jgi:hypothetical protein
MPRAEPVAAGLHSDIEFARAGDVSLTLDAHVPSGPGPFPTCILVHGGGSRNTPLRGSKGDTWEGGIRVPFLVRWSDRLPADKKFEQSVIQLDIPATALSIAGVDVRPDAKLDGVNLLPYLEGQNSAAPHEALYWRFGSQMATRREAWKLVRASRGAKEYEDIASQPMLFDLGADVREQHDLAAQHSHPTVALGAMTPSATMASAMTPSATAPSVITPSEITRSVATCSATVSVPARLAIVLAAATWISVATRPTGPISARFALTSVATTSAASPHGRSRPRMWGSRSLRKSPRRV